LLIALFSDEVCGEGYQEEVIDVELPYPYSFLSGFLLFAVSGATHTVFIPAMCLLSSFVCTINEAGSEVMTSGLARLFINVAEMLSRIRTKGLNCINIFIHRFITIDGIKACKIPTSLYRIHTL
jgi:hypothetical protein